MAPPKVKPIGGRVVIPRGYFLGRISKGDGPPELVSIEQAKAHGMIPVALKPIGPAGGDLGGTYPAPLVVGVQGVPVDDTAPTDGQLLIFVDADGQIEWVTRGFVPVGGTTGQVLTKIDGANFNTHWTTPSGGGGGGGFSSYIIDGADVYVAMVNSLADPSFVTDSDGVPIYVKQ